MAQITEKELSALGDLLTMEETLQAKCNYLATHTADGALADCYRQMAQHHRRHLEDLYANLK